jgi:hypothetical protein
MANKSFFNEIFLVKEEANFCKLVIQCAFNIVPDHIPAISDPSNSSSFTDSLKYTIGWWSGMCSEYAIIIRSVEIFFPPFMEYLKIDSNLYKELKDEGIELTIKTGIKIDIREEEIDKQSMFYIKEVLQKFSQNSFNNN